MFTQHCPVYPCRCSRCSSPDGLEPGVHYAKRGAVKSVARKGWLSAIIITVTLAGSASAEVLHKGKVYRTTADRIIAERQLVCDYSRPRFDALPDGRTVVVMGKVCTEVSGKR